MKIDARPYAFPYEGLGDAPVAALVVLGCDRAQAADLGAAADVVLANAERLRAAFAGSGRAVVLGRRGVADAADLPPVVRARNARRTEDRIRTFDDPLTEPAIATDGATLFGHRADNAFLGSDLGHLLSRAGAQALVFCGFRTEGSIHATMREANDRGFECLLVSDATASGDPAFHKTILSLTVFGNGLFGCVADTDAVLAGLERAA